MRRNLSIILAAVIVVAVLIGLSAASFVTLDRPDESELDPRRSSYNAGPTGTRAFYQLLEESGTNVARWKAGFEELRAVKHTDLMVIVGPFPPEHRPSSREQESLKRWVVAGGRLLVISREATREFDDPGLRVIPKVTDEEWSKSPDEIADQKSDRLVVQPTRLTRGLKGLQLSTLASRMKVERRIVAAPTPAESPTPEPSPTEGEETDVLSAPVIHLGDGDGAVLADFDYGEGRIVLLSDPFFIANNGIARGANLNLAMNLINELRGDGGRVLIDEAHHGFRQSHNQLISYFRGTPAPWIASQLMLVALFVAYTYGKRFARPLPLPQVDRHSPLEFVGSMAHLQRLAAARDLALENIYPPFRAELCRSLGVSVRAGFEEIATAFIRREAKRPGANKMSSGDLTKLLRECEGALAGVPIDDQELVALTAGMRRLREELIP